MLPFGINITIFGTKNIEKNRSGKFEPLDNLYRKIFKQRRNIIEYNFAYSMRKS